ncbi:MAG: DUF1343 domain-containing protein [Candidatus Aminicenantes bacterium]|nr:DUF1343 domain-containing protein [Candidatus Aminicenantes bacterium]
MLYLNKNKEALRRRNTGGVLSIFFISTILLFWFFPTKIALAPERQVELGNEMFVKNFSSELQGKSLGLVINHTSVLPPGRPLFQALLDKGQKIQAIFSPEHGFSGKVEAGKEVKDSQLKDIMIYSLYEKNKRPTPEQTYGIDAFVYDIQDVGTRFYTYITTLKYVLEAAAEAQIPVYVLDRPNPAGGDIIEGPLLRPEYESFIGALPIPVRYGLTPGELAMMMKGEGWVPKEFDLHVVRMKNWKRSYFWEDTGLPWIPPSPNMPTPETAIIYPGSSVLGTVKLNEGRGTPHPFLQFGAPWLDPSLLIKKLNGGEQFGIKLEAVNYTPRSLPGKALHPLYKNKECHGIRVRILQKEKFFSLRFSYEIIKALKNQQQHKLTTPSGYLNKIFGSNHLSDYIEGKISYEELISQVEQEEKSFREKRQKYLLYK